MYQSFSRYIFLLPLVTLFIWCSVSLSVFAQSAGVTIKPATTEETLDPGFEKQYSVTVKNLNDNEQKFYLFTRNIKGVRDGGVPIFADDYTEQTGYELSDWVELPISDLTLAPGAEQAFTFTIRVPEGAAPGSHFGGVFVSVEPPKMENSGAAVGYQVAHIVSIRVSGEANEAADIRQFSTSRFLYGSQDVDFNVRIENKGNVLVRPSGPLEVFNMLGHKVGSVTFNEVQYAVFPGSTREFTDITWKGDSVGFGRYEAILSPQYGDEGAKKTMSSSVTFWILPWNIIWPALSILGLILLIVFVFARLYIKRSLAHLNHGRRLVNRRRGNNSSVVLLVTVVTLTVTALFLIVLLALFA